MHNSITVKPEKRPSVIFLWLAIAGLLLFLFFFPLPKHNAFWALLQDTGHVPLFGAISLLLLSIFSRPLQKRIRSRKRQYLAAFLVTLFISAFVEIIQEFIPGREVSLNDFYLGAIGSLSFLLGFTLFDDVLHFATNMLRKILIFATSFTLLLTGVYPLLTLTAAYVSKSSNFPVLLTAEQTGTNPFLTIRENQYALDTPKQQAPHSPSNFLRFTPVTTADWPFIRLDEVAEDWSAQTTIQFELVSNAREPLPITILLDDQHARLAGQHSQQYHLQLVPGPNQIELPVLARTTKSPDFMDLKHMATIWVAFPKPRSTPRPSGDILIGEIRLR